MLKDKLAEKGFYLEGYIHPIYNGTASPNCRIEGDDLVFYGLNKGLSFVAPLKQMLEIKRDIYFFLWKNHLRGKLYKKGKIKRFRLEEDGPHVLITASFGRKPGILRLGSGLPLDFYKKFLFTHSYYSPFGDSTGMDTVIMLAEDLPEFNSLRNAKTTAI